MWENTDQKTPNTDTFPAMIFSKCEHIIHSKLQIILIMQEHNVYEKVTLFWSFWGTLN